ncbi:MAG: acyl-CoA dehydrogenase family protein [Bacteroidales bacterium]|nr:acyl-CoA dehydrogenase family protein [Bacteroidales bacterium]
MENKITLKGGEFLVKEVSANDIFIPEEFDEETNMIVETIDAFLETEIIPNLDRIDNQEEGLMRELIQKAGELGLLGIAVPEEYDGFNQSFLTTMRANEFIGAGHSYSVAYMAHTGIGTMPLTYYGNDKQKQKYLAKLASGEMAGAYCLTEPNAGSDANAGKTNAVLSEDGKHYIVNGQKMWITNGGFADLLTVFAKIDNDRVLSAFLVESNIDGITFNPEEKKLGIKGSSTRQIFFNDVKVPVENLLGRRGGGYRIALNILHLGRIKLAANVLGSAKSTINHSVNYANERKQFGSLISEFGAIKYKLAEQVIRTFVTESTVYRTSYDIQKTIENNIAEGMENGPALIEGVADFAVECALLKVYGSEVLDYVVDEAVQILGGMGYSSEMPVERAYRDSRINRIFEGTNEINRLLAVDSAMKRGMKHVYDLFENAAEIIEGIDDIEEINTSGLTYFEEKRANFKNFKKAILILIAKSSEGFQRKIAFEQEIMINISDMMMMMYIAESTSLRVEKLQNLKGEENIAIYKDILDVFVYDSSFIINKSGLEGINSFATGKDQVKLNGAISKLTKISPVNVKEARRRIANYLIEENRYTF